MTFKKLQKNHSRDCQDTQSQAGGGGGGGMSSAGGGGGTSDGGGGMSPGVSMSPEPKAKH